MNRKILGVLWVSFNTFSCFLVLANAWEEEDEIVLVTCQIENPELDMVSGPVKEKLKNFINELYEMRFNMKTGVASQKQLSASAVDFHRINESYTSRYVFIPYPFDVGNAVELRFWNRLKGIM
ncbi:carotenoid 9,10(9',10')-cleavage dioxygenase 1-like isoform X2 [Magnolia sinica]|uniref:carotenoid 9,10(9',10')-cleavage dioxygenase 1-like isoform X2 n=1 Tax=Magnolia sinica TaxID=86752 RepID=UPI002659D9EB|nr:carotenoid 9,10(9',10')-cleavage dioxygenase 1-like isoform X2 [Magnolia sinica]